jgi:hypothetical protein
MSYTPVPIVMAGDWIDEVFINTYWRDNMAAGVPDIFTTKGDLAIGSGNDSAGRLGVGADGTLLMADSLAALGMKWSRLPITFLKKSGDQSIGATTPSLVTWDVEVADDLGLHDNVTNNSRITFNQSGIYLIGFAMRADYYFDRAHLYINGGSGTNAYPNYDSHSGGPTTWSMSVLINVTAGDYYEIYVYNSGASSQKIYANHSTFFVIKIG